MKEKRELYVHFFVFFVAIQLLFGYVFSFPVHFVIFESTHLTVFVINTLLITFNYLFVLFYNKFYFNIYLRKIVVVNFFSFLFIFILIGKPFSAISYLAHLFKSVGLIDFFKTSVWLDVIQNDILFINLKLFF